MHIHIDKSVVNDKDRTTIKLLEVCPTFIKEIAKIRKSFKIENYSYKDTQKFANAHKGKFPKVYLCIQDNQEKLLESKKFQNDVNKLCKQFNLDNRWNIPMSHIILFSCVTVFPTGIYCWIDKDIDKDSILGYPSILIKVTSDVSKEGLVNWVRNNWDKYKNGSEAKGVIKRQKGVPEVDYLKFDRDLISLREGKHLSVHQISLFLMEKYKEDKPYYNLALNEQLIEQRIKRYRKLFGLK